MSALTGPSNNTSECLGGKTLKLSPMKFSLNLKDHHEIKSIASEDINEIDRDSDHVNIKREK